MDGFDVRLLLLLVTMSVSCTNTQSPASSSIGRRKGFKLFEGKVWSDNQCALIQFYPSEDPDDCIQECSYYPDCNAFNYIGSGCVLRDCPSPVPEPEDDGVDYFKGYYIDADNSIDQPEDKPISSSNQNKVPHSILKTSTTQPISDVSTSQPVSVTSTNEPIAAAPISRPISFSPIQPIAEYPVNRTSEIVAIRDSEAISEKEDLSDLNDTLIENITLINKPISVVPNSQPVSVSPSNQPVTALPISRPITFTPIQPIAFYPENRTSEIVVDSNREFETVEEKEDKSNFNGKNTPIHQLITIGPTSVSISSTSKNKSITVAPISQPISLSTIRPIAEYPAKRTSKFVDSIRVFENSLENYEQSSVNDTLVEALHAAAKANLPEVVKALLNAGINKNVKNDEGMTPLYVASWFGSLAVVQKLIEYGVDVDIQANNGSTPLMVATWRGNINIVKALLDADANTELTNLNGETVLHNAAAYNRPNIAKLLLQDGIDTMKQDKWGLTPEELAREQGFSIVADIIRDSSSSSETHQQTISSTVDPSLDDPSLQITTLTPDTDIQTTMETTSVDDPSFQITTLTPDTDIQTTMETISNHTAIVLDHSEKISLDNLSSQTSTISPNSQKSFFITSNQPAKVLGHEMWKAANRGDLLFVNKFIQSGTDLNWKNPSQNHSTALHLASSANNTEIVSALLEQGAKRDIVNDAGMTPIYLASWNGNTEVVDKLIEYNADVDIQANNGSTPLMVATWQGHVDIVKALLEANANTSLMNVHNETALHNAAAYNRPTIARLLLEEGADTKKKDEWEFTPVERANKQGNPEVANIIKNFTNISSETTNATTEGV